MKDISTLSLLPQGKKAEIYCVPTNCSLYTRFNDLGITKGATVTCVRRKKSIAAYLIKSTVIALRNEDTECIKILPSRSAFDDPV